MAGQEVVARDHRRRGHSPDRRAAVKFEGFALAPLSPLKTQMSTDTVRALLLTDVVDSTKLSEALGDAAMADVWAAHDRVARDLLVPWRGREIDKTDGMLLLFDNASDAVGYALAYHAGLAALPSGIQARAGLHVGPVILRENLPDDVARGAKPLEVDGMAKPTAARVMSLARGGQTLLTAEARLALGGTVLKVESHGHWMLKGVSDPLELFEIGAAEARFVAPSDSDKVFRVVRQGDWWLPVKDIPNNLPHQGTSFIGRAKELDDIKALLGTQRLVTLLGMGGLGKTRLSLQAAAETISRYPDGVWFLDLSPIRDAALVVSEAAQVLGLREEPGRPLIQTVCAHLRALKVLFVIDNCEHLIQACADLAAAILKAAPHVRMVASSREALRVPGEQAYPILPLPVPVKGDSIETLAGMTAVRLFVERAQQHKPAFELNAREAPAVAELVARLEGIPLALELAAARVRQLSVVDINLRLSDRYKLLTGGGRVLQQRQQTLRALVDWSYDILGENEQLLLQRLSVFRGGFALEAAEQVCAADPIDSLDVLDLLGSLVEKSLVMLDDRGAEPRYRMLDTIIDYAREKLEQAGSTAQTGARHCEHFFALAKSTNKGLQGPEQALWVRRMETELDNTRAALALALAGGVDTFIAVKIAVAMQGFWTLRGYLSEGRAAVSAALALPDVQASPMAQAHALYVGAALAASQSDYAEAERMLETCLALRRQLGNTADIAATLSTLALARFGRGDTHGALAGEQEALTLFRESGHRVGEAVALLHLGQFFTRLDDGDAARSHLQAGLTLARQIKHLEVEAECELVLGQLAFTMGGPEMAARHFARSLDVCKASGDSHGEASVRWWQGKLALEAGRLGDAREELSAALEAFLISERRMETLLCLRDHARLMLRLGAAEPAVVVASAAAAGLALIGVPQTESADRRWQAELEALHAALPDAPAFQRAWDAGQEAGLDAAVRCVLATLPSAATS
jgi:predicted ATPase/class 3 adenylate cyclase